MRVLLANYRLPFPAYVSGANLANHELLVGLAGCGHSVRGLFVAPHAMLPEVAAKLTTMGVVPTVGADRIDFLLDGVPALICDEESFPVEYRRILAEDQPDAVLMGNPLFRVDEASLFVPGPWRYYFILHSIEALRRFGAHLERFSALITVSKFMQELVEERLGVAAALVYPVSAGSPAPRGGASAECLTMVNPLPIKGGAMILDLARVMPQRRFLIVEAWRSPSKDGLDFSSCANVTLVPNTRDMAAVYARTRVLLVPSLWPEPWGRVVFEAAQHGIPVIASNCGGLPEVVLGNGLLVDNHQSVADWEAAIAALDDPETYEACRQASQKVLERYRYENEVKALAAVLSGP